MLSFHGSVTFWQVRILLTSNSLLALNDYGIKTWQMLSILVELLFWNVYEGTKAVLEFLECSGRNSFAAASLLLDTSCVILGIVWQVTKVSINSSSFDSSKKLNEWNPFTHFYLEKESNMFTIQVCLILLDISSSPSKYQTEIYISIPI